MWGTIIIIIIYFPEKLLWKKIICFFIKFGSLDKGVVTFGGKNKVAQSYLNGGENVLGGVSNQFLLCDSMCNSILKD